MNSRIGVWELLSQCVDVLFLFGVLKNQTISNLATLSCTQKFFEKKGTPYLPLICGHMQELKDELSGLDDEVTAALLRECGMDESQMALAVEPSTFDAQPAAPGTPGIFDQETVPGSPFTENQPDQVFGQQTVPGSPLAKTPTGIPNQPSVPQKQEPTSSEPPKETLAEPGNTLLDADSLEMKSTSLSKNDVGDNKFASSVTPRTPALGASRKGKDRFASFFLGVCFKKYVHIYLLTELF